MSDEPIVILIRDLRTWCRTNGIKQKDLAPMLDVSPQLITEWFHGRAEPSGKLVLRVQDLMKPKAARRKKIDAKVARGMTLEP